MTSVPTKTMMTSGHRPTDQDKKGRHMHTRIRDVCAKQGSKLGRQGERNGDTGKKESLLWRSRKDDIDHNRRGWRRQSLVNEVYFVRNGRILRVSEVNRMGHSVIVHAVRSMQGGGKKAKKSPRHRVEFFRNGHCRDGVYESTRS